MTTDPAAKADRRRRLLRAFEEKLALPMIALSLVWLVLVIVELIWGATPLREALTAAIWLVFIAEFVVRFVLAPEKLAFLRVNWLTVIALAAPALRLFAIFRILQVTRGLMLFKVVTTANRAMNALGRVLRRRGLGYVLALTIVVCLLGAAGEYAFESSKKVEGGFNSYGDALWWTAMVMTTMGSGAWPQTVEGRVLCVLLAIYAFAIFGYITASIAAYFLGDEPSAGDLARQELSALRSEIAELRAELRQPQARGKAQKPPA